MLKMEKLMKLNLIKALKTSRGILAKAAKLLGVTRQTVNNWVEHYELWEFVERVREKRRNEPRKRKNEEIDINIEY